MRQIPKHFQDFCLRIGGKNRFGGPNWRVVWGPDRREMVGGAWCDPDGTVRIEMRSVLKYDSKPVYHLEKWCDPVMYGDPDAWERENALILDGLVPLMGIQIIGPYPWRGEYEHSFALSGRLYFYTLEKLIKLNIQSREISVEERKQERARQDEKKKKDWMDMVVDMYKDRVHAFYNPVSFRGQTMHTSFEDRVEEVARQMAKGISGDEMKKNLGLGFAQKEKD